MSQPHRRSVSAPPAIADRAFDTAFNEDHILAITQAICEYRGRQRRRRPAVSGQGHARAFRAGVCQRARSSGGQRRRDHDRSATCGYTPTPALSHAILTYNRQAAARRGLADGIVITPSHNPPDDGGFKYNPPHGGPADTTATKWIEDRANAILADGLRDVRRAGLTRGRWPPSTTHRHDYVAAYVNDLASVVDMDAVRDAGLVAGRRSAGRRGHRLLGPHRRTVRA